MALRWRLTWGPKINYYARFGRDCPEKAPPKPEIASHLIFIWNAFWELSADRPVGMGIGRIPFSSIDRFARRYRIHDLDAFDRFRTLVRAMDEEFMSVQTSSLKPGEVSTQDADGVRGLFKQISAAKTAELET